ncbi:MAG: endonuclease domain-containing protein [bacterium]|nr:endonuclease domain-containing protein [bacterium]
MIGRRIELREDATRAEKLLWEKLKSRQLNGHKFRRQHGIGRYVVDFYHGKTRTIIELDGSVHLVPEVAGNDQFRQGYLELMGCQFLRFSNEEVFHDLESVLTKILDLVESPPDPPTPYQGETHSILNVHRQVLRNIKFWKGLP